MAKKKECFFPMWKRKQAVEEENWDWSIRSSCAPRLIWLDLMPVWMDPWTNISHVLRLPKIAPVVANKQQPEDWAGGVGFQTWPSRNVEVVCNTQREGTLRSIPCRLYVHMLILPSKTKLGHHPYSQETWFVHVWTTRQIMSRPSVQWRLSSVW